MRRYVAPLLLLLALLIGFPPSVSATPTTRGNTSKPPQTNVSAATAGSVHSISGVDLHDGMMLSFGGTYYLYGTQYSCAAGQFRWGITTASVWCGFGVATSSSPDGPWSAITILVSRTSTDPWNGRTWQDECTRASNAGCFNPRMVQRYDGVWILSFNSPADYAVEHANAYNFMGCEGPSGPCGPGSGPHGSYNKPAAYTCATNGDFTIFNSGSTAYIVCTMPNQTMAEEQLDVNWTNGTGNIAGHGATNLAGFTRAEGPGVYYDVASSLWVMTLSYYNCGYGSGCGAAYATASSPMGPWTAPANWGFAVDAKARAVLSFNSCGGQPRTVSVVDGVPLQGIDLWVPGTAGDSRNQSAAGILFTPLAFHNPANTPGTGWQPFDNLECQ
jgi:hypothetical protein